MSVAALFQSTPFTIYTGELTKHLEEGETCVFEVEMSRCDIITRREYESGTLLNPEAAFSMYPSPLYIQLPPGGGKRLRTGFRPPGVRSV